MASAVTEASATTVLIWEIMVSEATILDLVTMVALKISASKKIDAHNID